MGLYLLPEGTHADFAKELSRFFWAARDGHQRYHMVKLADVCAPKCFGGHRYPGLPALQCGLDVKVGLAHPEGRRGALAATYQGQIPPRPASFGMRAAGGVAVL